MLRDTTRREASSVIPGPFQPLISVISRSTATDLRSIIGKLHPLKKRRTEAVYWTTKIRQIGKVPSPNKAGPTAQVRPGSPQPSPVDFQAPQRMEVPQPLGALSPALFYAHFELLFSPFIWLGPPLLHSVHVVLCPVHAPQKPGTASPQPAAWGGRPRSGSSCSSPGPAAHSSARLAPSFSTFLDSPISFSYFVVVGRSWVKAFVRPSAKTDSNRPLGSPHPLAPASTSRPSSRPQPPPGAALSQPTLTEVPTWLHVWGWAALSTAESLPQIELQPC